MSAANMRREIPLFANRRELVRTCRGLRGRLLQRQWRQHDGVNAGNIAAVASGNAPGGAAKVSSRVAIAAPASEAVATEANHRHQQHAHFRVIETAINRLQAGRFDGAKHPICRRRPASCQLIIAGRVRHPAVPSATAQIRC